MRKVLGKFYLLYRTWYIVFSVVSLLPILAYHSTLPNQFLFIWHGYWRIVQVLLLVYACVMFYCGKNAYDMKYFLGLRGINGFCKGVEEEPEMSFQVGGILRYVRHPWYSGGIVFLWGAGAVTDTTLIVKCILTSYFIIGTLLEERKLVKEIGKTYREYQEQVPMLIPWKIVKLA